MAVKVFGNERLVSTDVNTYLANSGLVFIKQQALSGTGTNVTSCFSSDYDNYRIVVSGLTWNGTSDLYYRLLSGTTEYVSPVYGWAYTGLSVGGANLNNTVISNQTLGFTGSTNNGANNLMVGSVVMDIMNPNLAQRTYASIASVGHDSTFFHRTGMSVYNATDVANGIRFMTGTAQTATGTATVYGYRKV